MQALEHEVKELRERCAELEKENQEMKDEQESLRTVNKLTYEDLNKVNSDLLAEVRELDMLFFPLKAVFLRFHLRTNGWIRIANGYYFIFQMRKV